MRRPDGVSKWKKFVNWALDDDAPAVNQTKAALIYVKQVTATATTS